MGTIVCQGLQSCLESQMVESRTLRLRLFAPKPSTHSLELSLKSSSSSSSSDGDNKTLTHKSTPAVDSGTGWSFIQALSDPNSPSHVLKPAPLYAVKRSVSCLSDKSLQLCTENLGSETGTDHVADSDPDRNYLFSWEAVPQSEPNSPAPAPADSLPAAVAGCDNKYKRSRSSSAGAGRGSGGGFPPPLTTMRGSELVQVRRPRREGGRLVIEAVKSRCQPSCFEAERINGRLRLHVAVVKDSECEIDDSASEEVADGNGVEGGEEEEEEEEEEILVREGDGEEELTERKSNRNSNSAWRCKEEGGRHNNNNNNIIINKGLFNWEPFWAATASLQV